MKYINLLIIVVLLVSACGQKGNLYLPDSEPESTKSEAKKKQEKN